MKILDIGCGDGARINTYLYRQGDCVGVEPDGSMLKQARERARPGASFLQGTAENIPVGNALFDQAYAFDVLEHVRDPEKSVSELARVIKPGGRLILAVPHPRSERVIGALDPEYFTPKMHVRVFTRHTLRALVERHGFRVIRMYGCNFFDALSVTYQAAARLGFETQSGRTERRDPLFSFLEALGFLERSSFEQIRLKLQSMDKAWLFPLAGVAHIGLWTVGKLGALAYPKSLYVEAFRVGMVRTRSRQ